MVSPIDSEIDLTFPSIADYEPESQMRRFPVLDALRKSGEPDALVPAMYQFGVGEHQREVWNRPSIVIFNRLAKR